jgi:hypothetical protein
VQASSHSKQKASFAGLLFFSDPGEIRTLDPMIKSHLLYQLSYGVIFTRTRWKENCGYYRIRTCDPYPVKVVL